MKKYLEIIRNLLIKSIFKMNSQMQIYLQNAVFSAFTLVNLVNDLLDMAKMETETFQINSAYFNMVEVVT